MIKLFKPYFTILIREKGDGLRCAMLLLVLATAAVLEAVGIGLVLPFIKLLQDESFVSQVPLLPWLARQVGASSHRSLIILAGAVLIVAFVTKNVYLSIANAFQMRFIYVRMSRAARQLLSAYLHKPYTFHVQTNSAVVVRDIINDTAQVFTYSMVSVFVVIIEGLTAVVVAALLLSLAPLAMLCATVGTGAVALLLQRLFVRRTVALGVEAREQQALMMQWANQALGGIKEIQVLGCEDYFVDRFATAAEGQAEALRRYRVTQLMPRYVLETMGIVGLVGFTVAILLRGGDPTQLLPLLGVFVVAVVRILPSLARVAASMTEIRYADSASKKIAAQLDALVPAERNASAKRLLLRRSLALRNVSVRYPGSDEFALNDVSFDVTKGETVAVVGPSGAGKTTIADVIIGLLSPTTGHVEVDDQLIDQTNRRGWQRSVGYIPQNVYLIDDSLRRNIAFGVSDNEVNGARLDDAVVAAQLDGVLRTLPDGLDTTVGERGVRLSGGQRQRVGIARVLYLDAQLLVMDEATSALDGITERDVVEAIDTLKGKRTMIIIAHRLSTVRKCDRLIYIERGRVSEIGTWSEVERNSASFRELLHTTTSPERGQVG